MSTFVTVSAVTPVGEGRFVADVHPDWTIGGRPNGGYLLAILGRAASAATPHPHPIAASAHFLRSPTPSRAVVEIEVLRSGRSASQVRARLLQDDQTCVEALLTMSALDPDATPFWAAGAPTPGSSDTTGSLRVPSVNPAGVPVPIMDHLDLRIERESLGFTRGEPSGRGDLRGWLGFADGTPFDPVSLLFAVDALPPATFDVQATGWVPTLELTVYVRALPAPGPLRVTQHANLIDAQRVDETCWVWDSTGRIVAHGTQLAGIRLG